MNTRGFRIKCSIGLPLCKLVTKPAKVSTGYKTGVLQQPERRICMTVCLHQACCVEYQFGTSRTDRFSSASNVTDDAGSRHTCAQAGSVFVTAADHYKRVYTQSQSISNIRTEFPQRGGG